MKERLKFLLGRIPWRLLIALVGVILVANGGTQLLSVELPADSETVTQAANQGMGMVITGGVTLIAAIMIR
jgi:hypothetical protein